MQNLNLPDDYECEGQMNIYDYLSEPEPDCLIAVSKVFASAIKQMNLAEWKTFLLALTQIKWTEENKECVYLDKKFLAKSAGINSDIDHRSENLNRTIGELPAHSLLKFSSADGKKWKNGCFIVEIDGTMENIVKLTFRREYMPLFQNLGAETPYITMWADDLFKMSSERAIIFYEDLRLHSDTRKENSRIYGIKELKKMFSMPKDGKGSYVRKSGSFDRPAFEKKVIVPLCEELQKCQMIHFTVNDDGKLYRKIKQGKRVLGYEFQWIISEHPKVATAEEVKLLNQNPQDLKIAKDLAKGRKKATKADFEQNTYDYDQLEKDFLRN